MNLTNCIASESPDAPTSGCYDVWSRWIGLEFDSPRRAAYAPYGRMVTSKDGIRYEHFIANEVYDRSENYLIPQRDGFSGNGAVPSADVQIDDGEKLHIFELKRTEDDTSKVFEYDPDPDTTDDIHELIEFAQNHPRNVCAYVGVRFNGRQLILAKVWARNDNPLEHIVETCPVDATVTHGDNVSIRKPPTENQDPDEGWPSASTGDDVKYLLETIGYWTDEESE